MTAQPADDAVDHPARSGTALLPRRTEHVEPTSPPARARPADEG